MIQGRFKINPLGQTALALAIALSATAATQAALITPTPPLVAVRGDRPSVVDAGAAKAVSALASSKQLGITVTLPLSRQAELDQFVADVSNPSSPFYGHYLTPNDFAVKFGASQADFDAVLAWAKANGLTVTQTSLSRNSISLNGTAAQVGQAFGVKFYNYIDSKSNAFFSASAAPKLPAALAGVINGVYGLSNYAAGRPMYHIVSPGERAHLLAAKVAGMGKSSPVNPSVLTSTTGAGGTGHDGAFSPHDLNSAYQMPVFSNSGKGQGVGCFEQGGFYAKDPVVYQKYYKLPATPVIARLVAGSSGAPVGGVATEAALDIETELAMAPHVNAVYVYEAATESSFSGQLVDALNAVADDDKVSAFDISYGIDEALQLSDGGPTGLADEADALKRCAAEGISVYVSAGDSGAYGDLGSDFYPATYNVSDPASQPEATAVGGTTLFLNDGFDYDEITWNELGSTGGATGGGTSDLWKLPSYQKYADGTSVGTYNGGSATYRNVPDVAADADSLTPVDVYTSDLNEDGIPYGWIGVGGTSASAPIWAGFTAVANQQRAGAGMRPIGFANPLLYTLYDYSEFDFNDVDDGTNGNVNLFGDPGFAAGIGYDNTTGCGTLTGSIILSDIVALPSFVTPTGTLPTAPTDFKLTGSTSNSVSLTWKPATHATGYVITTTARDDYYFGNYFATKLVKTTSLTSVTIGFLAKNTSYEFSVAAVNNHGSTYDTDDVVDLDTP